MNDHRRGETRGYPPAVMALCRASCRLRVKAIRDAHAEVCEGIEGGGGGPARFYEATSLIYSLKSATE
jgi:hypothetical protein